MPSDPLASWVDGDLKDSILTFVRTVTDETSPDHRPPAERIAVFDNDGTLWPEQPLYIQLAFALDRVKTLAPQHPEWRTTQPFQGLLEGDPRRPGVGRPAGAARPDGRDAHRHDQRGVRCHREGLVRGRLAPTLRPTATPSSPTSR